MPLSNALLDSVHNVIREQCVNEPDTENIPINQSKRDLPNHDHRQNPHDVCLIWKQFESSPWKFDDFCSRSLQNSHDM